MKSHYLPFYSILFLCFFMGCSKDDDTAMSRPSNTNNGNPPPPVTYTEWLIPKGEVFDGGPGKDGIPSINEPNFSDISQINFLEPDELIIGIKVGNEIKGYPHSIMDWHEIVNDEIDNLPLSISYCPLTSTNIAWHRQVDGKVTTFGVSGLVYNTNLIPYDRETDSNWSQIYTKSVNGQQAGDELDIYPLIETTWETWQNMFPNSLVLNTDTGFDRDYERYPYYDYKTNHDLVMFPLNPDDDRLPKKQKGLGVLVDDKAKFYALVKMEDSTTIFFDKINDTEIAVIGSKEKQFIVAYERTSFGNSPLNFEPIYDGTPSRVFKDELGNEYNLFGEVETGPNIGEKLNSPKNFMGFWLAWSSFYPNIEIY